MNKRIKELAEKCLEYSDMHQRELFSREKFAELIIRECIVLAMHQHMSKSPEHYSDLDEYDKGCDDTASSIASSIRFCFGVKD